MVTNRGNLRIKAVSLTQRNWLIAAGVALSIVIITLTGAYMALTARAATVERVTFKLKSSGNYLSVDDRGRAIQHSTPRQFDLVSPDFSEYKQLRDVQTGKCLTAGGTRNEARPQLTNCNASDWQQHWRIRPYIDSRASGRVLDAYWNKRGSGDAVIIFDNHEGDNQHWTKAAVETQPPVTPPAEDTRFEQVFRDDFATTAPISQENWWEYGGISSASLSPFNPQNVAIKDGTLVLSSTKAADGSWSGAGVGSRLDQTYGRWTVRAKSQKGEGITFVNLLWPQTNKWTSEIDFAEENGNPNRDTIHAFVHKVTNETDVNTILTTNTKVDVTQYHEYSVEWTPELIVVKVDGVEFGRVSNHGLHEPMHLGLQTEPWTGKQPSTWQNKVSENTPSKVDMTIDWVKIDRLK